MVGYSHIQYHDITISYQYQVLDYVIIGRCGNALPLRCPHDHSTVVSTQIHSPNFTCPVNMIVMLKASNPLLRIYRFPLDWYLPILVICLSVPELCKVIGIH